MPHSTAASSQPRCTCGRVGLCSASTTPTLRWPSDTRWRTAIAAPSAWSVTTDSRHRVVRAGGGGAFEQDDRDPGRGQPLERAAGRRRVHPGRDDEAVDAGSVDEAGQLRPVVVGVVGRAAQHDAQVELAGGLLGAARHVRPVVVQRRHQHAERSDRRACDAASRCRRQAGCVVGAMSADAAVHPADQPFGGELGDVAADRDRGGAEGCGQVGDAQRAVALQRLEQLRPPGDLQRAAVVRRRHCVSSTVQTSVPIGP